MSWSSSYGGTCSAPSSSSSSSSGSSSSSSSSSGSGYTDGWSNNSAYTSKGTNTGFSNNGSSATQNGYSGSLGVAKTKDPASQKGVYATPTAMQYLSDQVASKRATPEDVNSAKAMIAGKEAAQGQGLLSSMLATAGATALGPVGWAAGKAAGWLGGKAMDSASEYSSNPNYQVSKDKTDDDSTLVGKVIGTVAPAGVNGFAEMAYNDKMGDYNSYVNGLKSNMVKNGYMDASKPVVQQTGSSSSSSLANTIKTPQTAQTTTSNDNISGVDPTDVDWSTFNFYSGSVV